jgi:putative ABC transport system permease protein
MTVERVLRDTRYGLRLLLRTPVFAAVAILSLALGIGANAAIFQLIDTVRFRALPVADPQGLVEVRADGVDGFGISASFNAAVTHPLWEQMRAHQSAFASMFAWGNAEFFVGRGDEARQVRGLWVSGDFFRVLGITPERGRMIEPGDDRRGCGAGAAVVSHAFWQNFLGGRDAAIGSTLTILDRPFTVVGVAPARFTGLEVGQSFDVALPLCAAALTGDALDRRDLWWLTVMGRLKPDWTLPRANDYFRTLSPALLDATVPTGYGADLIAQYRAFKFGVVPAGRGVSRLRGAHGTSLSLLFGLTGLVLLMTCANLATLMLARASAREREVAIRVAIGASRWRIVSQLLIESLIVAAVGAALAVPVALVAGRALIAFFDTPASPVALQLAADWRLLAFVGTSAALTVMLFGLAPAIRVSDVDPIAALRLSSRGLTADRHRARLQRGLVVAQVAVSLVLVVSALLFVRSFRNLMLVATGFEQDRTAVVWALDRQASDLPIEQRIAFQKRLTDEIASVPGVAAAGAGTHIPLSGGSWWHFFHVPGSASSERQGSRFNYVSPGYFRTLRIPILSGRDFEDRDTAASRRVMVVNESFARGHLEGMNSLGATIRTVAEAGYPETTYEIVGVVGNTKYGDLREEMPPIAYVPMAQNPGLFPWAPVFIRSETVLSGVTAPILQRVKTLKPGLVVEIIELKGVIRQRLIAERTTAWLGGAFGVLAVVIVTVGLYGIIAYQTASRRHEIGIRLSLGSTRGQIVTLVLRESLWLLALGVLLGVPLAVAAMRGAGTFIFGLEPTDLATLSGATALLAVAAGIAGSVPAWRAARISPDVALRHD